jgi:hypothetical protein
MQKIIIKKNKLWFFSLFSVFLILSTLTIFILPDRYFNDTKIIVIDKYKEIGWIGSYPFAIMFYNITKLKYLPFFVIALIQFPLTSYILYKIGVTNKFHKFNTKTLVMIVAFFLL